MRLWDWGISPNLPVLSEGDPSPSDIVIVPHSVGFVKGFFRSFLAILFPMGEPLVPILPQPLPLERYKYSIDLEWGQVFFEKSLLSFSQARRRKQKAASDQFAASLNSPSSSGRSMKDGHASFQLCLLATCLANFGLVVRWTHFPSLLST